MNKPLITGIVDDKTVIKLLRDIQSRSRDLTIPLREVGEQLLFSSDQRFEREVDPDGRPWKSNSPRTTARKRALGRILKVLQETGTGRASLNYRASRRSLEIGTPIDYMADHQLGRNGQAERRFLPITRDKTLPQEDQEPVIEILSAWVTEGRKGRGRRR